MKSSIVNVGRWVSPECRLLRCRWTILAGVGAFWGAMAAIGLYGQQIPEAPLNFDEHHQMTCTASGCHESQAPPPGMLRHPPFFEDKCLACHVDHQYDTPDLLKTTSNDLCLACHTAIEVKDQSSDIAHPSTNQTCLDCHHPHHSRVRNLLRDESKLAMCAECHGDFLKQAKEKPYSHNYFEPVNQCGNCHYTHMASDSKFLRPNVGESCLTCHDLPIKIQDRRLENVGRRLREANMIHDVMKDQSCPACHTPHGSTQSSLLLPGYPEGSYAQYHENQYDLCWTCHDSNILNADVANSPTRFRNADTNLHSIHVREAKRGRACHLCHEAHASDAPYLLKSQITFHQWKAQMIYEELPDGGRCATPCHREMEYRR